MGESLASVMRASMAAAASSASKIQMVDRTGHVIHAASRLNRQ
jgi:hypothetical protein